MSLFPMAFSTRLENYLPLSLNLELSYAHSFNLEESHICPLGDLNTKKQNTRFVQVQEFVDILFLKLHCDKIENILVKGENASDQHFLLFPQCFQKDSTFGSLKFNREFFI